MNPQSLSWVGDGDHSSCTKIQYKHGGACILWFLKGKGGRVQHFHCGR